MFDQLIIGNLASQDDFDASVKERKKYAPKKKSIKETVPFSNTTYDFSAINGEVYWEERKLEYVFEILASSPEELENKKIAFISWIMNVSNENIYDPFIQDYHFVGTFEELDEDDSEIEKSTITVSFTAYPYMIANEKKIYTFAVPARTNIEIEIFNNSSHRIIPIFVCDTEISVQIADVNYPLTIPETKSESLMLHVGNNSFTVKNTSDADGTLKVEFFEEVF